MFQDESRHLVEGLHAYTKEMSDTCRTLMSLSAGAIGLLITLLRDQMTHDERIEITIAVALFLIVVFLWKSFTGYLTLLRQKEAALAAKGPLPELVEDIRSREHTLITIHRWQGGLFTTAVVMSVFPVFWFSLTFFTGDRRSRPALVWRTGESVILPRCPRSSPKFARALS